MDVTPTMEPGLALLEQPDRGALHRLVLERVDRRETLWVDAGGAASTYGLTAAPSRRALQAIRVARAFTAHQHHQLVRNAVAETSERTGLVVVPNVATLYDGDDAPAAELDRLFEASVALLADLADARSIPVLVSAPRASADRRSVVADRAAYEIGCEATDLGYAYDAEGFDQHGYWGAGWWQTTIPYWVELFGAGPPVGALLDVVDADLGLDGPTTPVVAPGLDGDRRDGRSRTARAQADLGEW